MGSLRPNRIHLDKKVINSIKGNSTNRISNTNSFCGHLIAKYCVYMYPPNDIILKHLEARVNTLRKLKYNALRKFNILACIGKCRNVI